jgi:hypothetical protein
MQHTPYTHGEHLDDQRAISLNELASTRSTPFGFITQRAELLIAQNLLSNADHYLKVLEEI